MIEQRNNSKLCLKESIIKFFCMDNRLLLFALFIHAILSVISVRYCLARGYSFIWFALITNAITFVFLFIHYKKAMIPISEPKMVFFFATLPLVLFTLELLAIVTVKSLRLAVIYEYGFILITLVSYLVTFCLLLKERSSKLLSAFLALFETASMNLFLINQLHMFFATKSESLTHLSAGFLLYIEALIFIAIPSLFSISFHHRTF